MTISSEIQRIKNNIAGAYTACEEKGAALPAQQNSDNLPSCISAIPSSTPTIDSLTVTPMTTSQTITAGSGVDGYSPINVEAVTSSIDSNIVAGNIKKNVTILGVTGSYEGSGGIGIPRAVDSQGNYGVPTSSFTFSLPSNAIRIKEAALYAALEGSGVTSVDLHSVQNIENLGLRGAFGNCSKLSSVDLSSLTTLSGSQAMYATFRKCGLRQISLPMLDTVSGSQAMSFTFSDCDYLTSVDLSSLVTISGSQGLTSAFSNCTKLTSVDLSNLTTLSGIQAMDSIFWGCTSLISLSFDSLTTVTGASALGYLCEQCTNLTSVSFPELTALQANNVFRYAFDQCTSLTSVSFPKLVNLRSYNGIFSYAFQDCTSLTDIRFPALNSTSFTGSTSQFNYMLTRVTGCTVHFPSNLQSVIGSWTDVVAGFGGTNTIVLFDLPATE